MRFTVFSLRVVIIITAKVFIINTNTFQLKNFFLKNGKENCKNDFAKLKRHIQLCHPEEIFYEILFKSHADKKKKSLTPFAHS